jgi:hypothetical protein
MALLSWLKQQNTLIEARLVHFGAYKTPKNSRQKKELCQTLRSNGHDLHDY